MSQRRDNLRQLASRLVALQEKARSLGIFTGDRELLECPNCGLLEDVTSTGQLITCRPQSLGHDTGLRFEELPQDRFRCPACGSMVQKDQGRWCQARIFDFSRKRGEFNSSGKTTVSFPKVSFAKAMR